MNETKRTIIFGGVAVVLALLAFITAPARVAPDAFFDLGEVFFPEFTDPNAAASLEVIDYDQETGAAIPFKVINNNGKWSIPSHHDYPADGKDRLARTAASVIGIKKDEFRSDNVTDHEFLGVIDPLDETVTTLKGRGQRITLKGSNDEVLADLIISKEDIEGRENFRFVRIPGQKRVYASRMEIDISTKFNDWIEADLLKVNKSDIDLITLKDYSIDERTRKVENRDTIVLTKDGSDWQADKMKSNEEVNKTKVNDMLTALDDIKIVGVRPKPEGLSAALTRTDGEGELSRGDLLSLQSRGFYLTNDGSLLSNEGEVQAQTKDGVVYTLRFGEIVTGTGLAVTAGVSSEVSGEDTEDEESGENRYLFVTTEFKADLFPEPKKPANTDFASKADSLWTEQDRVNKELQDEHDKWAAQIGTGRETSNDLNERFAGWYYVIASSSFDKLHLTRADLVKKKEDEK
jgi:hypothetical protein